MARERLPNRRQSRVITVEYNNENFHVTYSREQSMPFAGPIKEVFAHGYKVGSDLQSFMISTFTAISIALQCGASLEELAHGCARGTNGEPTDVVGAILTALLAEPSE